MNGKFIYVGRLEEIKGIPLLMMAWKIMGDEAPELILCGDGPLGNWCQQFSSYVTMKGYVANCEVRKLIACSDALIFPTQVYEGFPMTIVEAFSAGTPVIGSNMGNVNDLIEEGKNGYKFQYNSKVSLIETVKKMCTHPFRVGAEYAERYSAYKNYELLKNIYDLVSLER